MATALSAWIIALVFGSSSACCARCRRSPPPGSAYAYVEFFRNMPLLVQLFLWFFVLPELLPRELGRWLKQMPNAPFYTAAIGARAFHVGARRRAGARRHRLAAARPEAWPATALGLTTAQAYRYVLLPMAFRIIMPPLTSEFLNYHQEHLGGDHHRPDRTDRPGALDAGILLPGVRGLHRRDRDVSPDQHRRASRHALPRTQVAIPGYIASRK